MNLRIQLSDTPDPISGLSPHAPPTIHESVDGDIHKSPGSVFSRFDVLDRVYHVEDEGMLIHIPDKLDRVGLFPLATNGPDACHSAASSSPSPKGGMLWPRSTRISAAHSTTLEPGP